MQVTTGTLVHFSVRVDPFLDRIRDPILLLGRVLIATIFVYDATLMARFPDANAAYMQQFGLSAILLYPTALFQFVGGLMIVVGLWTRLAAIALAAFCVATAVLFHRDLGDLNALIQFGKDFGLAGGYLILAAQGPGFWSIDGALRHAA